MVEGISDVKKTPGEVGVRRPGFVIFFATGLWIFAAIYSAKNIDRACLYIVVGLQYYVLDVLLSLALFFLGVRALLRVASFEQGHGETWRDDRRAHMLLAASAFVSSLVVAVFAFWNGPCLTWPFHSY